MDDMPPIVSRWEIALILGVSRQHAHELTKHPTFPKPYASLGSTRNVDIWRTADVRKWNDEVRPAVMEVRKPRRTRKAVAA